MNKYTLGVDFGSLSVRAAIVSLDDGKEVSSAEREYAHGVMSDEFRGAPLPPDWALQDPGDYEAQMYECVREAVEKARVPSAQIVGMGIDFTSCTILPVDENGRPLCEKAEFKNEKHAYAKMWKHHAASEYADRMTEIAARRKERFLARYGGKISSEWALPKIAETADKCPRVYDAAYAFMDAGDWVVLLLTGEWTRSEAIAGFKYLYGRGEGFPSADFLAEIDPRLRGLTETKLRGRILAQGKLAGRLTREAAMRCGLTEGTPVATANIDAHAAFPAAGNLSCGSMLAVIGTSAVYLATSDSLRPVSGICGAVEDGVAPGVSAYEAGQAGMGDVLGWAADNCGGALKEEARRAGVSVHELLTARAEKLRVGESGLVALDWLSGNRSLLADYSLSGLLAGITLSTRPEEIYRALMEGLCFGARMIKENFEASGVPVRTIFATGGIAYKNAFFMQMFADITGAAVRLIATASGPAVGSAIFGAAASGEYRTVNDAASAMGGLGSREFVPRPEYAREYDKLFKIYKRLHDSFAANGIMRDIMQDLRRLRLSASNAD